MFEYSLHSSMNLEYERVGVRDSHCHCSTALCLQQRVWYLLPEWSTQRHRAVAHPWSDSCGICGEKVAGNWTEKKKDWHLLNTKKIQGQEIEDREPSTNIDCSGIEPCLCRHTCLIAVVAFRAVAGQREFESKDCHPQM